MKNIKYIILNILLLKSLSIFSMKEEIIDINKITETSNLLNNNYKKYSLSNNTNNNSNKLNSKKFIELLPKEIWKEIISYLDYKDNQKTIINFIARLLPLDDLIAKKIAINVFRASIMHVSNLKDFKNLTNNIFKHWKNEDNIKLVQDHLKILETHFLNSLDSNLQSIITDQKLSSEEIIIKLLQNKFKNLINYNDVIRFDNSKFRVTPFECYDKHDNPNLKKDCMHFPLLVISFLICSIPLIATIFLPNDSLFKTLGYIIAGPWCLNLICIFSTIKVFSEHLSFDATSRKNFIKKLNNEIKKYLKENNLNLSDTDNCFLKLLDHGSSIEEIKDLNIV